MKKANTIQNRFGLFVALVIFLCAAHFSAAAQTAGKYKEGDRIAVGTSYYEVVECRRNRTSGEEECDVLPRHADGLTGALLTVPVTQLQRYEQQDKAAKKRQALIDKPNRASTAENKAEAAPEKESEDVARPSGEAELSVTAQQLYNEYKNNDTAARNKYVGRTVRVTGAVIYTISETKFSARHSKTYSGSTIQCIIEDLEQIPTLNEGETVTLVGKPLGSMTSSGVIFEPCRVERSGKSQTVKTKTATAQAPGKATGGIAGSWYYTAIINPDGTERKISNGESYLWLKDDGSYENRFGGVGQIGTYTASSARLTLNRENVGAKTYTMTMTGATMTLKSGAGSYRLEKGN